MEKYISVDNIDSYYEQVVKRQMSSATVAKLVGGLVIILTAIVVSIVLMVTVADWLFPFVLMMVGLGGYLIYYLLKHSRVEYEYTFVLGELRIAKIKGRSKRRTITYFDVKNIDDLGRYVNQQTGKRNIDPSKHPNLLHAAVDDYRYDTYYFIIHDKVRKKPAVLLMTPNEKTFSLIRPYLSVELKKKFIEMQKDDELIQSVIEAQNKIYAEKAGKRSGKDTVRESAAKQTSDGSASDEQKADDDQKSSEHDTFGTEKKTDTEAPKTDSKKNSTSHSNGNAQKSSQGQKKKNHRNHKKTQQRKNGSSGS